MRCVPLERRARIQASQHNKHTEFTCHWFPLYARPYASASLRYCRQDHLLIVSPALQGCEIRSAATRTPVASETHVNVRARAYSNKYFDEVDEEHGVDELGDNHETGNDTRVKKSSQKQAVRI